MPLSQTLRKNSNVLWTISIIQDQNPNAQTKSEFAEMANDVVSTDTIKNVTLCAADNLQRFRLMIHHGISEEEAIQECQRMSNQWCMDNIESVEKLKCKNISFLGWQEFLEWPERSNTLLELEKWYKENRDFKNAIDGRTRQAGENISPDAKISNPVQQTELLKKYLFEECAFQKFAASKGFDYELYKTQPCKAMQRVKNNIDFVPRGYMVGIHFTQFNPSKKNTSNERPILSEKESFAPVFNKISEKLPVAIELSLPVKVAEFIEKTFQILPHKEQEKAFEALIKFTTQEILPLCYLDRSNLKI